MAPDRIRRYAAMGLGGRAARYGITEVALLRHADGSLVLLFVLHDADAGTVEFAEDAFDVFEASVGDSFACSLLVLHDPGGITEARPLLDLSPYTVDRLYRRPA